MTPPHNSQGCNKKDCQLINPIYVGEEKESYHCQTHNRPYWPNRVDSQELEGEVSSVLHLNGCQQRTAGYNEALDGKDLDTVDAERLESITLKEVMSLFSRATEQARQEVLDELENKAVPVIKERIYKSNGAYREFFPAVPLSVIQSKRSQEDSHNGK